MPAAFRCLLGSVSSFDVNFVLGALSDSIAESRFESTRWQQVNAWKKQWLILQSQVGKLIDRYEEARNWMLLLEYEIPRRGKRPDAIVIADNLIFVLEFKTGDDYQISSVDRWQAFTYALDLQDYHLQSRHFDIVPILVVEHNRAGSADRAPLSSDGVELVEVGFVALADLMIGRHRILVDKSRQVVTADSWEDSAYRPRPTIVDAARSFFHGNTVADLQASFGLDLRKTTNVISKIIDDACRKSRRVVCFVTGIPGAGKTLAGLGAVHRDSKASGTTSLGMFLSGNGPLVNVIREALVRDAKQRGQSAFEAKRNVATFIDNAHLFFREYLADEATKPPPENVIVFDEAQRAWNRKQNKRSRGFDVSEPEGLLAIMERVPRWCVIVALVGSGQEINRGEAGIGEWGNAINSSGTPWLVAASPSVIRGDESTAGHRLFCDTTRKEVREYPELHLDVGVRSPRAIWLGEWVNSLVDSNKSEVVIDQRVKYPVVMTRSLDAARNWLREVADETERIGLVASSGALRLRADGLEISPAFRQGFSYENWFLSNRDDVRSSDRLEVAATEFECQGLELDWVTVCWGGDFLFDGNNRTWCFRSFRGAKWVQVRDRTVQTYIRNKYRVLLTRARKGIVLYLPNPCESDETRRSAQFDHTADRILASGVNCVDR